MNLIDSHGREINYLRLSVTDRCNLRCTYCMPPEGVKRFDHSEILSYEELHRIASAAVSIGVRKIRITGGEPLVRRGITGFLASLAKIPGLERLVLTTNGTLLPEMAHELRAAGVESLNISLDSLNAATFATMTRGGELQRVLEGIETSLAVGFRYIKVNVVVIRGVNDHEIDDFARLTLTSPLRIRFIEYMPTVAEPGWEQKVVSGSEILSRLGEQFRLEEEFSDTFSGPAKCYRIPGGMGGVGVITPLSCHFCSSCNRIRVTSRGLAKSCLFDNGSVDLKPYLAEGDAAPLCAALRSVVAQKPERHRLVDEKPEPGRIQMVSIGG